MTDAERRRELAAKGQTPEKPVRRIVTTAVPKEPPPEPKRFSFELSAEDTQRFDKVRKMSASQSDVEHIERALSFFDAMLSTDLDMTFEGDKSDEMLVERSSLRNVRSYTLLPSEAEVEKEKKAPKEPSVVPKMPVLGAVTLSTGRKVRVVLQYPPPAGLTSKEKAELRTARVVFKGKH